MKNTTGYRLLIASLMAVSAMVVSGCGAAADAGTAQVSRSASGALDGAPPVQPPAPQAPGGVVSADGGQPSDGTGGVGGVDADSPEAVARAAGMSPDQVAGYCRQAGDLALWGAPAEVGSPANFSHGADIVTALKPFTPAALKSDVALIYNDYRAIATTQRVYVQVKGELDAAYGRVMDFRHSICDQG